MRISFLSPLGAAWICWAIVGLSPIVGKYAVGVINPPLLVFLGALIGSFILLPAVLKQQEWGNILSASNRWKFLFIGTFGTALPFTILLSALHYTTPGNAAILQQSELIYSLCFAMLFLKESPSRKQLIGSLLVMLGAVLILLKAPYTAQWKGDLMILGSTWMLQAASTVAKKLPQGISPAAIGLARNLYALPALGILLICTYAGGDKTVFQPSFQLFAVIGYTGVLKYGLAMWVWYRAIRALDLSKVTAIYLSYPAMTLLLSALLGLEKPSPAQVGGLLLSLYGGYLISRHIKNRG